jgi:hypothetical protein
MFPPLLNRASPRAHVTQQTSATAEAKLAPAVHYTFLLIGLSLLVFVLHRLDGILLPLFFAALLATLLLPVVTKLESWRWPRALAIVAAIFPAGERHCGAVHSFWHPDHGLESGAAPDSAEAGGVSGPGPAVAARPVWHARDEQGRTHRLLAELGQEIGGRLFGQHH